MSKKKMIFNLNIEIDEDWSDDNEVNISIDSPSQELLVNFVAGALAEAPKLRLLFHEALYKISTNEICQQIDSEIEKELLKNLTIHNA